MRRKWRKRREEEELENEEKDIEGRREGRERNGS